MQQNDGFFRYRRIAEDFMKTEGMHPDLIDLDVCLQKYKKEMEKGLNQDESSLLMLPMYVSDTIEFKKNDKVIAIDIGGTNIRIALVRLNEGSSLFLENYCTYKMPGINEPLDCSRFFDELASLILPYIKETKKIGISFAYEARITPDLDGEIISFSKEVQINGAAGKLIGDSLKKSLTKLNAPKVIISITNDPVAAALSGIEEDRCRKYDGFIGLIVGTGTNSCYCELNKNIKVLPNVEQDFSMYINVESGYYQQIPKGNADVVFFEKTQHPEVAILEKMVSGRYLGNLFYFVVLEAVKKGLFSKDFSIGFFKQDVLSTVQMSNFLSNPKSGGVYTNLCNSDSDENVLFVLAELLVVRASKLIALEIAGAAVKSKKGRNKEKPICVVSEGTTFYAMPRLRESTKKWLDDWLGKRLGIYTQLIKIEDAVIKGAGVIGACKNS